MKLPTVRARCVGAWLVSAVLAVGCHSNPKMGEVKVENGPTTGWGAGKPNVPGGTLNALNDQ